MSYLQVSSHLPCQVVIELTRRNRSRKVKCDEIKPRCLRCFQSRIQCAGYAQSASTHDPNDVVKRNKQCAPVPGASQFVPFRAYLDSAALAHIGFHDLLKPNNAIYHVGRKAWKYLLERYANASVSGHAACIVFGAATQLQNCNPSLTSHLQNILQRHYGAAVSLLREDVNHVATRLPAIFVTGLILCSVELLFRRRQNALKHIAAIFHIVQRDHQFDFSTASYASVEIRSLSMPCDTSSDFHLLLYIVDIQVLSYSEGARLPFTKPCPLQLLGQQILARNAESWTDADMVYLIHATYAFIAEAAHEKPSVDSKTKSNVSAGPLLDILEHAVLLLDFAIADSTKQLQHTSLKVLRNFCFVGVALLGNIFSMTESGWGAQHTRLEAIISSAEGVLASTDTEARNSFVPQLGLIPPLAVAAFKCREPLWRRRAISCLKRLGVEGPWNAAMIAALTQRCMELEESTADGIPSETSMISLSCIMDNNGEHDLTSWPSSAHGSTMAKFCRRVQPAVFAQGLLPLSAHYKKDDTTANVSLAWKCWEERIGFT